MRLVGFVVVELLPTVRADVKPFWINAAVRVRIQLVRALHLPCLHQVLHDHLQ